MGIFDKLFGKHRTTERRPPDRMKLIRAFAKKRVMQDPLAKLAGFHPSMVDELPPHVLIGLPEATLLTIVESFAILVQEEGASPQQALAAIERHRSIEISGVAHPPAMLEEYVVYRVALEHQDGPSIQREHVADCVLMARTLYRC